MAVVWYTVSLDPQITGFVRKLQIVPVLFYVLKKKTTQNLLVWFIILESLNFQFFIHVECYNFGQLQGNVPEDWNFLIQLSYIFSENGGSWVETVLPQKPAWSGFCFTPPKVTTVTYHLFIFVGTRACIDFT